MHPLDSFAKDCDKPPANDAALHAIKGWLKGKGKGKGKYGKHGQAGKGNKKGQGN